MHLRLAHDAFIDPKLSSEVRERRVCKLLAGAARHQTDAVRFEVKEIIERDRRDIENKKRGRAAAKLVKRRPSADGAKVIPIRRDG